MSSFSFSFSSSLFFFFFLIFQIQKQGGFPLYFSFTPRTLQALVSKLLLFLQRVPDACGVTNPPLCTLQLNSCICSFPTKKGPPRYACGGHRKAHPYTDRAHTQLKSHEVMVGPACRSLLSFPKLRSSHCLKHRDVESTTKADPSSWGSLGTAWPAWVTLPPGAFPSRA